MDDLNQAYAETVQAVAASVTDVMDGEWGERDWRRLVVNHESLLHTAEPEASTIAFAVATKPGGEPRSSTSASRAPPRTASSASPTSCTRRRASTGPSAT